MAPIPVVFRLPDVTLNSITEAGELSAEQLEVIPYPVGTPDTNPESANWPPPGFTTGALDMATATATGSSLLSQMPAPTDLEWIQGDTAVFEWVFTDVFWMIHNPGIDDPDNPDDVAVPLYNNVARPITNSVLTNNVVTLTSTGHGYLEGYAVEVSGVGVPYDGIFVIDTVTANTFSYVVENANVATSAETGSAKIANMPVWEAREWAAQVRNPYIYSTYAADYWVPAYGYQYNWWRGHSIVAEFDPTTTVVSIPATEITPVTWGTKITITLPANRSAAILPGNWYHWDLQTRSITDEVRTWLRGKSRILTEWTVR